MTKPVVGITGASGFIGMAFTTVLRKAGFRVVRFSRSNLREYSQGDERYFSMEGPDSRGLMSGIDILVHCAWNLDDKKDVSEKNVAGSRTVFESAKEAGVRKIIFISSVAAHDQTQSSYGLAKLAVERMLDVNRHAILKPGLVIGNGGLFRKLSDFALSRKVVPLIDHGEQPLQYIGIEELCQALLTIIQKDLHGTFVAASEEAVPYREFFRQLGMAARVRLRLVDIPGWSIRFLLWLGNIARIQLPINSTNLNGLKSMKYIAPQNDPEKLGIMVRPLQDNLRSYFSDVEEDK